MTGKCVCTKKYKNSYFPSRVKIIHVFISHDEKTFYSYTVTGKMFYTYAITGFFFYFYPITENDHNYSYPITGKYSIHMPSQENVQIHNPSRESFIFISRTGNFSCSYPITGK